MDKNLQDLRERTQCVANPIGTNDFDYEDKQKTQDSIQVYEGLHFNLAAENSRKLFYIMHYTVIAPYYVCYAVKFISTVYNLSVKSIMDNCL